MANSPTQRTMKRLKELGYTAQIVEKFNPWVKIRQDCFGFGDILAMRPGVGILLIQTTSGTNHASRVSKIRESAEAATWRESGGAVEVWSWAKRGERGKRKTWELRREQVV